MRNCKSMGRVRETLAKAERDMKMALRAMLIYEKLSPYPEKLQPNI